MAILTTIQVVSKPESEWISTNPVIGFNVAAHSTGTNQIRIGDGVTNWSGLPIDVLHTSTPPHSESHHPDGKDPLSLEQLGIIRQFAENTVEADSSWTISLRDDFSNYQYLQISIKFEENDKLYDAMTLVYYEFDSIAKTLKITNSYTESVHLYVTISQ